MTCFHPRKGWIVGTHPSGKPKYKITSYDVQSVSVNLDNGFVTQLDYIPTVCLPNSFVVRDFVEIPCQQCKGCRLDYSSQWATRLMLELGYHDDAHFVTLTYRNEDLPKNPKTVPKLEEVDRLAAEYNFDEYTKNALKYNIAKGISSPLCKEHVSTFMKDLRSYVDYHSEEKIKLRYFCSGEYGDQKGRPHYHMILFGLPLKSDDKENLDLWSFNEIGQPVYRSKYLENIWEKGNVMVGKCTWESCAYTARYILKKQKGEHAAEFYEQLGIVPEFTMMSNKPGIARQYYEDNKFDIYKHKFLNLSTPDGGKRVTIPRYFDKLLSEESPEVMAEIKAIRKECAIQKMNRELKGTSKTRSDYLLDKEAKFENKVYKKLKRKGDFHEKKNAEA